LIFIPDGIPRGATHDEIGGCETMSALFTALTRLFADPNIGRDAIYEPADGEPFPVRVIARRADAIAEFGAARLWSETTRFDLRVAEVASPRPGDRLVLDGEIFIVQGEPVRDRERAVWTLDVRPE
jgi:hypothetical protein